jgi:hypothetical protein
MIVLTFFRYNKIEFGKNRKNAEAVELSKRARKSKAGIKESA